MGQSPRDSRSPERRRRPWEGPRSSPPSSVPVPDPPRGQPYFPLLLRLFPLLRGGDRALRAWVRFLGLPGPLRAKLLWGSSRLSLKKNHTLGCEPGGGGGAEQGHTMCPRHSGPHTPLKAYQSGPTERQRLREPDRGAAARPGLRPGGEGGAHSLGLAAPLQLQQLSLLFLVLSLDLGQPHAEVQLHGVHVLQGGLHGEHLRGDEG